MPKKRCGFGFDCSSMLLQPGLEAKDCPNLLTCGSVSELTPEEEVELLVATEREAEATEREAQARWERIRVSRRQAAVMMLRARGCPQSLQSLGITELLSQVEAQVDQVRSRVRDVEQAGYVAPEGVEAHEYNVKRPQWVRTQEGRTEIGRVVYCYNKLTAREPIFAPEERREGVKVIHLSHDDDSRNLEARAGVKRRNRLLEVKTQLRIAMAALEEAERLAAEGDAQS